MNKFLTDNEFKGVSKHFQDYIQTNLSQLKYIFWIILTVAIVGLAIILMAGLGIFKSGTDKVSIIALISGTVLEFISAVFLLIYRLTLRQAQSFMIMIERINTVSMSLEVLNTIEEDQKLKNEYAAKIAERLLYIDYGDKNNVTK